jgi:hypothetical protein
VLALELCAVISAHTVPSLFRIPSSLSRTYHREVSAGLRTRRALGRHWKLFIVLVVLGYLRGAFRNAIESVLRRAVRAKERVMAGRTTVRLRSAGAARRRNMVTAVVVRCASVRRRTACTFDVWCSPRRAGSSGWRGARPKRITMLTAGCDRLLALSSQIQGQRSWQIQSIIC